MAKKALKPARNEIEVLRDKIGETEIRLLMAVEAFEAAEKYDRHTANCDKCADWHAESKCSCRGAGECDCWCHECDSPCSIAEKLKERAIRMRTAFLEGQRAEEEEDLDGSDIDAGDDLDSALEDPLEDPGSNEDDLLDDPNADDDDD